MRNLVFLVFLGLGISYFIYYFANHTKDTSPIAEENISEKRLNGQEGAIDGSLAYDIQKQNKQALVCIANKADKADINLNDATLDLIQANNIENSSQNLNPDTKRRAAFFGQYKLKKFIHQYHEEGCAYTMPNNYLAPDGFA